MFDVLADYLKTRGSLSDDEIELVRSRSVSKKIRKKQFLLQEGEVCRYNSFVTKGCLRLYQVSDDGVEHILRFATETWWISDYSSYHTGVPADKCIDALEDSELIQFTKKDFDELMEASPRLRSFREKLDAKSYDAAQNRILRNIRDSAEKRYENFIATYPDIFQRVPLHMVASYLGLTRETLSRVRRDSRMRS